MTDILKSPFVGGKTTEAEYKPRIYVCSPYRPRSQDPFAVKKELECNIDRAKTACRMVADLGGVPICSHLFCTQFLDDNIPAEREKGRKLGLEMLKDADELWCSPNTSQRVWQQKSRKLRSFPYRFGCSARLPGF